MRRFLYPLVGLTLTCIPWVASAQAQSSAPQAYSLTQTTYMTEVSMFSGQVSNLKVYRHGSKEVVELTIAPWPAEPKGIHQRYLFDFQAHKAYIQDFTHNACSWKNYISARAPVTYDPITGMGEAERAQMAAAKQHALGTETINGIPARIMEFESKDGKFRYWFAQKGDFPVKLAIQGQNGKFGTMMEVKQVDFSPPAAALFVPPANCSTQSAGDWSDTKMNAHAEANINVQGSASANAATGETHAHVTATMRQGSSSSRSQATAPGTDSSAEDFLDSTDIFHMPPATKTCTVLFRAVRGGTMQPITSGLDISLDGRDVTGQYRRGILRLSNPPKRFSMQVQEKNGPGRAAQLSRACFRPETVLLLVIGPGEMEDHWYWVKSGKYATVSAAPEGHGTSSAGQETQSGVTQAQVTAVHLQVTPTNYSGPCPVKVKLIGTLTADGPGTAYYQFQAGAVGATREGTMNVDAAGSQTVSNEGRVVRTPQVQSVRFLAGMEPRGHQENAKYTDVDLNITCTPAK
jgi:hypothetical protein